MGVGVAAGVPATDVEVWSMVETEVDMAGGAAAETREGEEKAMQRRARAIVGRK